MNRIIKRIVLCLVVVFLNISVLPVQADTQIDIQVRGTYCQTEARSMLEMVNDFRTGSDAWYWNADNATKTVCRNLKALTYDYNLEKIAMRRAAEIMLRFDHANIQNKMFWSVSVNGVTSSGENIHMAYPASDANHAFTGWREDDQNYSGQGHRRNMLYADFSCIGIAKFVVDGTAYWVQEFGYQNTDPTVDKANDGTGLVNLTIPSSAVVSKMAADTDYAKPLNSRLKPKAGTYEELPKVAVCTTLQGQNWPSVFETEAKWKSSDPAVASVQGDTIVYHKQGTVNLTATVTINGQTASDSSVITVADKNGELPQPSDPVEAFVTRLYRLCLTREPDAGGKAYWVDLLRTRQRSAAQVVYGFFFSEEMKNLHLPDEEYVERCYSVMMDRKSDKSGKKYWLEHLTNGVTRLYVVRGFVESNEFTAICNQYGVTRGSLNLTDPRDQNYGITSFVARCYTKALGRNFDEGGLTNWVNQILYASNRKQAAIDTASTGFFHSQEFRNKKLGNTAYVKVLYRTFLGREYDESGLKYWVGHLKNKTKTRDEVLYGFAWSKEFNEIMAGYGIY